MIKMRMMKKRLIEYDSAVMMMMMMIALLEMVKLFWIYSVIM